MLLVDKSLKRRKGAEERETEFQRRKAEVIGWCVGDGDGDVIHYYETSSNSNSNGLLGFFLLLIIFGMVAFGREGTDLT